MTFIELQIQFDLNPDNRVNVLKNVDTCRWIDNGYLFVDQENGQCYLFDMNGNPDDINKVKYIKDYVFLKCKSLTTIKIPNLVERIGIRAFYGCISLINIEIPSSVKSIGEYAFWNCKSLTNIKIPDSVKKIEKWAFTSCESLASITIPDSVESIGTCAFASCKSLVSIKIPDSVKLIGYNAFIDCLSLKEVVFKSKTICQVTAMNYYPWGILNESIIKCLN